MFAVVKTGGKQYRVAVDDVIKIEKLAGEAGGTVEFTEVLMVGDDSGVTVGTPLVSGQPVVGEIVEQTRGDKIIVFKKKRRQHYRRKAGHRQDLTVVRIVGIGDHKSGPKPVKAKAAKPAPTDASASDAATDDGPVETPKKAPAKKAAAAKAAPKAAAKTDNTEE